MGNAFDDRAKQFRNPLAGLAADAERLFAGKREDLLHLLVAERQIGRRQVDLVDHRNDLEILPEGEVDVGDGLRLHPLRGVDQQQSAFAGAERTGDLIGEVDVSGRVDEIEFIGVPIGEGVVHPDRMGLDGNAAFAFEIHPVEELLLQIADGDRSGQFEQPVGQRGFAVIDVRDDAEVADQFKFCHICNPGVCFLFIRII